MRIYRGTVVLGLLLCSCSANVKVEPVEVKPIKMTIDVNIKVDRELDEFFDFEESENDEASDSIDPQQGA